MLDRYRETIPAYAGLVVFQTLLTDASVHDDERVGQGYDDLKRLGYYWVAVRVRAEFVRRPAADGPLTLETWVNPAETAAIDRNYTISDTRGILAAGRAKWVLVRLSDGAPVRLANVPGLLATRRFEAAVALAPGFPPTPAFTSDVRADVVVPASAIDLNGHLNNARYWELVFAAARPLGLPAGEVEAIGISYQKALYEGERVTIHFRRDGAEIGFCGYVRRAGLELRAFGGTYVPRI
jgi:acyl-ACP thioesterase